MIYSIHNLRTLLHFIDFVEGGQPLKGGLYIIHYILPEDCGLNLDPKFNYHKPNNIKVLGLFNL